MKVQQRPGNVLIPTIMLHSFVRKERFFNINIQNTCSFRTVKGIPVFPILVDRHLNYSFTPMNDIVSKITYNHEFNLFPGKETRCKYTILSIRYDIS